MQSEVAIGRAPAWLLAALLSSAVAHPIANASATELSADLASATPTAAEIADGVRTRSDLIGHRAGMRTNASEATSALAAVETACQTGAGLFDFGPHRDDLEAEQLAMAVTAELRAPDAVYDRIRGDLALVRQQYPVLTNVVDDPDYVPNNLIVRLAATGPAPGFEALNAFYQVVAIKLLFSNIYVLTFCDNLNAYQLESIYEALSDEVLWAEPNNYYGNAQEITASPYLPDYEYSIVDGSGDCQSGCICARYWLFGVGDRGDVFLYYYSERQPGCLYADTVCCGAEMTCDIEPVGSCLDAGGVPQDFSATCGICEDVAVPGLSGWGIVGMAVVVFAAALVMQVGHASRHRAP